MDEDKSWHVISQCQLLLKNSARNSGRFMDFQNTVGSYLLTGGGVSEQEVVLHASFFVGFFV